MNYNKKCKKCGKPSYQYDLCSDCYEEEKNANYNYEDFNYYALPYQGYTNCIICKKETTGQPYCKKCYSTSKENLIERLNEEVYKEMNKLPNNFTECVKCGKKTNGKPLCFNCYDFSIRTFGLENTLWELKEYYQIEQQKTNVKWKSKEYTYCLNCNTKTNGYAFCSKCEEKLEYQKQIEMIKDYENDKNKSNTQTITEKEDIRKKWEAEYKTTHGEYVRSRAEVIIANILHNKKIQYEYEKQIIFTNKTKALCDFYLPEYKTYIEFWGSEEEYYLKRKKEKITNYETLKGYKLLQIGDEELKHIDDFINELIDTN